MGKSTSRRTDEARCRRILAIAQHCRCVLDGTTSWQPALSWPHAFQDALVNFRAGRDKYQRRYKDRDIPIPHVEAVAFIKSYPKLAGNSKEWNVAAMVADCIDLCNGQWVILEDELKRQKAAWLGLDGENDPWQRFLAQEALDVLGSVNCDVLADVSCPDKRVSRPPGRYHAGANLLRDTVIRYVLSQVEGCGLPMHQHRSPSSMDGTGYQTRNNNDGTWTVLDKIGDDVRGTYDSEADARSALREFAANECSPNSIIAACAEAFGMTYKAVEKLWRQRSN